jgi:hypothetical protein
MLDGAFGGTAPNTTDPAPEKVQLSFSDPHNLYCTPATVMLLACAWAFSTPNAASIVATATGSSLKYLIIVRVCS